MLLHIDMQNYLHIIKAISTLKRFSFFVHLQKTRTALKIICPQSPKQYSIFDCWDEHNFFHIFLFFLSFQEVYRQVAKNSKRGWTVHKWRISKNFSFRRTHTMIRGNRRVIWWEENVSLIAFYSSGGKMFWSFFRLLKGECFLTVPGYAASPDSCLCQNEG